MPALLAAFEVIEQPETARVVEADDGAVVESQDDMVVRCVRQICRAGRDPSGHAEMEQQEPVRVELDQNVFSAPAERADACAVELRGERGWKRSPQIRPAQLGMQNAATAHFKREAAPDRLDLRQFGHGASMPEEVRVRGSYGGSNWRIMAYAILDGYFPAP